MCGSAVALGLLVAPCDPSAMPVLALTPPASNPTPIVRTLTDPELERIRGSGGYLVKSGRNGVVRIVQDSNLRDMTLAVSVIGQQMDAWWGETGLTYLVAGALRP